MTPDLSPEALHILGLLPRYGHAGASIEAPDWDTFALVFGTGHPSPAVIEDAVAELVREEHCLLSRTPEGWLAITVLGVPARVR